MKDKDEVLPLVPRLSGDYGYGAFDQRNADLKRIEPLVKALLAVQEWLLETGPIKADGIYHPLFVKANNMVNKALADYAKSKGKPAPEWED